jgi:uncharacterized repeat protein (TIGR01451 family)
MKPTKTFSRTCATCLFVLMFALSAGVCAARMNTGGGTTAYWFATITGTKTVSGTFTPNGTITYTITLQHSGDRPQFDNPGNEFVDVLPASLTLIDATANLGTAVATPATNTVTWNGLLSASDSVIITITATIGEGAGGQVISNQGQIIFDADDNGINDSITLTDDPGVVGSSDPTSFTVGLAFDLCLQDDSNGNRLQINTSTGAYQFHNCAGLMWGGSGTVTIRGGLVTLSDARSDGQVLAKIDRSIKKGTASVRLFLTGATFTITDRNTVDSTCGCPS